MNATITKAGIAAWALACAALGLGSGSALAADAKEKPAQYTFVAGWTVPRAEWADMPQVAAAAEQVASKAIAAGTLTAFGSDTRLVHTKEADTHDVWWSAHSLAAVLGVLDEMFKSGVAASAALNAATAHDDVIFVSRHYNWRSGTVRNGYTRGAFYQLREDAPDDAIATLSRSFVAPVLDKLVAEGTLQGYEIDEEAVHTAKPGGFWLFYIAGTADGLDKTNAALQAALDANPLAGAAIGSMVQYAKHRDSLFRTNAIFK